jgi:hypothetical protein
VLGEDLPPAAWPGMLLAAVGAALATMRSRSAQPSTR